MAKRAQNRARIADLVVSALLSLLLAFVCLSVAPAVPSTLGEAVRWGGGGGSPVGPLGAWIGRVARWGLGPWLMWLLPLLPFLWIPLRRTRDRSLVLRRAGWVSAFLLAFAGLASHEQLVRAGVPPRAGGAIGGAVEDLVARLLGPVGSFLLMAGVVAWLLLRPLPPLRFEMPALDRVLGPLGAAFGAGRDRIVSMAQGLGRLLAALGARLADAWAAWQEERALRRASAVSEGVGASETGPREARIVEGPAGPAARVVVEVVEDEDDEDDYDEEYDEEYDEYEEYEEDGDEEGEYEAEYDEEASEDRTQEHEESGALRAGASLGVTEGGEFRLSRDPSELLLDEQTRSTRRRRRRGDWPLPGLELLDDVEKEERGFSRDVLQMSARLLMDTLANYGIEGQINEIRPGPVVTTFEFEPAPGVKVSQITSRSDDLALAMRATRIRIEAPIPGKAAVGIEIPNPYPQVVGLKQVVGAIPDDDDPLSIAIGKDTEGSPFCADLADMPHLLVAGATGSGKSVCVNAIICNLLLRNGPDRVRLLMIDPKMLELSVYNGIPHLMHPVITEAREALKAVKYMVAEMETRYALLARHGVRNIKDFNERVRAGKAVDPKTNEKIRDPLPYCVFIIDELADLMMQLGNDLETPIARLAQMARAVGIHLVLATQRPSVNVITGVIKANFPSRVGFRVISKVDSRTILDTQGAEQLLGKGDMLILLAGMPQPKRVHGAFLSIEECERVVEYWRQYAEEEARLDLDGPDGGGGGVDIGEDELLDEARRLVVLTQTGSTTMLQRRLRVGYTRASRLMDMLEAAGVVGPYEGSKARKVLLSKEELEAEG